MRIAFWASALLLATISCAAAQRPVAVSAGNLISYCTAESSKTRLEIRTREGARYIVSLERDSTVSRNVKPSDVTVVGEVQGSVVILVDTYPSIPGGLSYCQAGKERFLRVISISKKPPEETIRFKLASCRENIELASPGIEWLPESSTLRIHWLLGPATRQKPEELSIRIGSDGKSVRLLAGSSVPR
jgi:hypothetical protein